MNEFEQYCEMLGKLDERFLAKVKPYSIVQLEPLTDKLKKWSDLKCEIKQCYSNSAKYVLTHNNANYVEGYICVAGIIIQHAWIAIDDKHYDLTAALFEQTYLSDENQYYARIQFNKQELRELYSKKSVLTPLEIFLAKR